MIETDGAAPIRLQVPEQIDRIFKIIQELEDVADTLEHRLDSALGPETPTVSGGVPGEDQGQLSQMAMSLNNIGDRANMISHRLLRILDRLQL